MQLSRSLFAIVFMGSIVSIPLKADVDYRLLVSGAGAALVTYLAARNIDETKKDIVSKTLNSGSKVTQNTIGFIKKHLVAGTAGLATGWALYHGKNVGNTHLVKFVSNLAKASNQVA